MRSTLPPLAFAALLLLPVAARAGLPGYQVLTKNGPATVYTTPSKATVIYGNTSGIDAAQQAALGRAYGLTLPGNPAGGVNVADAVKVALGGAVVDVVATRAVPPAAYPYIAVAMVGLGTYAMTTALRDYLTANDIDLDNSGQPTKWVGGQTVTNDRYQWSYQGTFSRGTIGAARDVIAATWIQQMSDAGWNPSLTSKSCSLSGSQYTCSFSANTPAYGAQNLSVQVTKIADTWCMDANGQLTIRPTGGLCPQGTPEPVPPGGLPDLLVNPPPNAPDLVRDAVEKGAEVSAADPVLSGPASGPGRAPSSSGTTSTDPAGQPAGSSSTSSTVINNYNYEGDTVTVTQTTTNTTLNPDGSTTTTVEDAEPDPLCGVPGYPACAVKVDEEGTPEWKQPDTKELDDIRDADAVKLNDVAQTIPEPDLGWFDAPPIAACQPFLFPNDIGEVNPCGVVDSVRSVMAYLWALVAAWMAFGWIRQAVNGG